MATRFLVGTTEGFKGNNIRKIISIGSKDICVLQRLDNEYRMRSSEAPLLKKLPSEYMQDFYYTSQPMEKPKDMDILEMTFKMIHAKTQLLYSSDYPHWDFDAPSTIYNLPFLSEQSKRNILGENARKLFHLNIT